MEPFPGEISITHTHTRTHSHALNKLASHLLGTDKYQSIKIKLFHLELNADM